MTRANLNHTTTVTIGDDQFLALKRVVVRRGATASIACGVVVVALLVGRRRLDVALVAHARGKHGEEGASFGSRLVRHGSTHSTRYAKSELVVVAMLAVGD